MSVADVVFKARVATAEDMPDVIKAALAECYRITRRVAGMSAGPVAASTYSDAENLGNLLRKLRPLAKDAATKGAIATAISSLGEAQLRVLNLARGSN